MGYTIVLILLDKTHCIIMITRSGRVYQVPETRKMTDSEARGTAEPTAESTSSDTAVSTEMLFAMLQQQQKLMTQQQEQQWVQQKEQQNLLWEMLERQKAEMEGYRRDVATLRDQRGGPEESRVKLPKPTLQKLEPMENIENFLATFERIATQQKWPESVWATQLAGLLTGKAMAAYTSLLASEAGDYKVVKKAILHRYYVNEETHRLRFCRDKKKREESYREWICRLTDHFEKWTKDSEMDLQELIIMEQVLLETPEDLAVWLRERNPRSLEELGKLAENYTQARKGEVARMKATAGGTGLWRAKSVEEKGSGEKSGRSGSTEGSRTKVNSRGEKQCYHCRQWGHLMFNCPNRNETKPKGSSIVRRCLSRSGLE